MTLEHTQTHSDTLRHTQTHTRMKTGLEASCRSVAGVLCHTSSQLAWLTTAKMNLNFNYFPTFPTFFLFDFLIMSREAHMKVTEGEQAHTQINTLINKTNTHVVDGCSPDAY